MIEGTKKVLARAALPDFIIFSSLLFSFSFVAVTWDYFAGWNRWKIETVVPARVAQPAAGITDARSTGRRPAAHLADHPGDLSGRISDAHHAHHPANLGRAQIHSSQRHTAGEFEYHRRKSTSRRPAGRDLAHALLILRVDYASGSGKHSTNPLFSFLGIDQGGHWVWLLGWSNGSFV